MKLNISYPATGCQKLIEIEDDMKLRPFYNQRMAAEVPADSLGDEWKGYIFRISGGNDKEGFPMKQGVLTTTRVRLLLREGHSCYHPRRRGERKRKSVRGCIVDANLSVLCMVIVKKGEQDIPGLTDKTIPRRLGPKRASKIRKLFNLTKDDDVRKYVIRHPVPVKEGQKPRFKHPKIQRLLTPLKLHRRRREQNEKVKRAVRRQEQAAEYAKLLALRLREAKDRRRQRLSSSRASLSKKAKARKSSTSSASAAEKKATLEAKKASVASKKPTAVAKKPTAVAKKPTAAAPAKKPTAAAPAKKPAAAAPAKKPAAAAPAKKPTAAAPAKKPAQEAKKPAAAAAKKPAPASAAAKKPAPAAAKKPTSAPTKKPTSAPAKKATGKK